MSDPSAATNLSSLRPGGEPAAPRANHKRKLLNYLIDPKLQLRYVLVVTILSAAIAGTLGFMIYQQHRAASESIEQDLRVFAQKTQAEEQGFQEEIADNLEHADRQLVYKMGAMGLGLVMILSMFLLVMTHKVAGPLYKVSLYFERMADGRLGVITPLRHGDMLQDFFAEFKAMHESLRARAAADAAVMLGAVHVLRASQDQNQSDYRGDAQRKLADELDALEQHAAELKKRLA